MVKVSLFVRLEAKGGREAEVESFHPGGVAGETLVCLLPVGRRRLHRRFERRVGAGEVIACPGRDGDVRRHRHALVATRYGLVESRRSGSNRRERTQSDSGPAGHSCPRMATG